MERNPGDDAPTPEAARAARVAELTARLAAVQRQLAALPDIAAVRQTEAPGLRAAMKALERELARLRREAADEGAPGEEPPG
ncbi:MAG TPA: hypothetical protein VFL91_17725 [Thermomicrobiales bacterium]|nr:hypothetical protein [Thermomicrobiales bacterium]